MTTNIADSIIDKLEAKRQSERLSSRKFAKKLGVSPELYRLIIARERRITDKTAARVRAIYPELEKDLYIFLSGSVEVSTLIKETSRDAPQTAPSQKLRGFWRWLKYFYLKIRFPRQIKAAQTLKSKTGGIK